MHPLLSANKDLYIDKGTKHDRVPLTRYLKGNNKIPIVTASFASYGRLMQSMTRALQHLHEAGERGLYIIALDDERFNELATVSSPEDSSPPKIIAGGSSTKQDGVGALRELNRLLATKVVPQSLINSYLGSSTTAQLIRNLILHAADHQNPVLVVGDSGTGKEMIAHQIHLNGPRHSGHYIPVNCAAIPDHLFESELFGHTKGAFTGASSARLGAFQSADNGTLFLDEIGELPLPQQAKLLRVLQEQKIKPIGAEYETRVDVRIIAATNRDLHAMVAQGQFREDLYYRLRGFLIRTQPLRQHIEDLLPIATTLWEQMGAGRYPALNSDVLNLMLNYSWPGNVRELKMVLNSLSSLFGDVGTLTDRHLHAVFQLQGQELVTNNPTQAPSRCHAPECLRHLGNVEEVIQATHYLTDPLLNTLGKDDEIVAAVTVQLRYRINELDELIFFTERFYHDELLQEVSHYRDALLQLWQQLKAGESTKAVAWWSDRKGELYQRIHSKVISVMDEIRKLL